MDEQKYHIKHIYIDTGYEVTSPVAWTKNQAQTKIDVVNEYHKKSGIKSTRYLVECGGEDCEINHDMKFSLDGKR